MYDKLHKVDHPIYSNNGYYGYMMSVQAFRLFNTVPWKDPINVGTLFKVPATAIIDMDQKSEERQWLTDARPDRKSVVYRLLT